MPHALVNRQAMMADAVLRIVARDGLEAVTASSVAAESGHSPEWVRRELTAEEVFLRLALTHAIDVLDRRIALHANETGITGVLGAMAEEVLPGRAGDFARRRGWLALLARTAAGPDLADPVRKRFAMAHRGVREGLAHAEPRTDSAARITAALIDGLTAHVLIGACTPGEATSALATHLR